MYDEVRYYFRSQTQIIEVGPSLTYLRPYLLGIYLGFLPIPPSVRAASNCFGHLYRHEVLVFNQ